MPRTPIDPAHEYEQRWLSDASALKTGWIWWIVLLTNMAMFAWGLRGVYTDSIVPLSCVWLGAFSCCMIFHLEAVKRILALRAEVERLRRTLEEHAQSTKCEVERNV